MQNAITLYITLYLILFIYLELIKYFISRQTLVKLWGRSSIVKKKHNTYFYKHTHTVYSLFKSFTDIETSQCTYYYALWYMMLILVIFLRTQQGVVSCSSYVCRTSAARSASRYWLARNSANCSFIIMQRELILRYYR